VSKVVHKPAKSSFLAHVGPLKTLRAGQYGVAHSLRIEGIAKGGASRLTRLQAFQEILDLVHKAMLVTNLQSCHPPVAHVRMVAVSHVNRPPAAHVTFNPVIEVFEPMQVVQVPFDRRVFAVDFERVESFMAAGVTR